MNTEMIRRLEEKTPQQHFLRILQQEFRLPPRVSEALLEEFQETFYASEKEQLRIGQVRAILAKREAKAGRALNETETTEVIWTLEAGSDDLRILKEQGAVGLRHAKLLRLLREALEQGAVATQEDLARVLQVSVPTIKRDFDYLREQGLELPSRGYIQGIGRGQTHKAQIVARWLKGQTYDQIAREVHHGYSSIKNYVNSFARVVWLHQQGYKIYQIALVLQIGEALVLEYLELYEHFNTEPYQKRLTACLERICGSKLAPKAKKRLP